MRREGWGRAWHDWVMVSRAYLHYLGSLSKGAIRRHVVSSIVPPCANQCSQGRGEGETAVVDGEFQKHWPMSAFSRRRSS